MKTKSLSVPITPFQIETLQEAGHHGEDSCIHPFSPFSDASRLGRLRALAGSVWIIYEPDPVKRAFHIQAGSVIFERMTDDNLSQTVLSDRLLGGLARFRNAGNVSGTALHAPGLFSYCVFERERLASVRLARPLIGIVLSGAKEVWLGDISERLTAGTMFVLPADVDLDIVNEPNDRTHLYQSLILEIEPDKIPSFNPADICQTDIELPPSSKGPMHGPFAVPLTAERVEAAIHAAYDIEAGPAEPFIVKARLNELLALLQTASAAKPLFNISVSEQVARLVRPELDRKWTARDIAGRLAMSESTLRRRLATEGRSLSEILRQERMAAARRLMAQGSSSGMAGLAVGYASRAHFARAFRSCYGVNPAGI